MNRAELDAFFAEADDVLTNWHGSVDSAGWRATEAWNDWATLPAAPGWVRQLAHDEGLDGWAARAEQRRREQAAWDGIPAAIDRVLAGFAAMGERLSMLAPSIAAAIRADGRVVLGYDPTRPRIVDDEGLRARALHLRQHRNTGPAPRAGLDGKMRR